MQNPTELKEAFEDANNSSGSALKENEKYLDSIQGKIDLFTNAVQTMWQNALDSDVVKFFVEVGTWLIKLVDNIGLINSVLIATSLIIMKINHMNFIEFFGSISKTIINVATKFVNFNKGIAGFVTSLTAVKKSTDIATVGSLRNAMAVAKVDEANKSAILSSLGLSNADKIQGISKDSLTASTISAMVAEGKLTQAQAGTIMSLLGIQTASNEVNAARMNEMLIAAGLDKVQRRQIITQLGLSGSLKKLNADEMMNALTSAGMAKADAEAIMAKLGLTAANKGLAASFAALWTAMLPILAVMAGVAVIWGIVKGVDALITTTVELAEELSDLKSELADTESEIDSLNSELETTKERMAELIALPSLSFVEQEELVELKQTTAELERQLKLKELLADSKRDAIVETSEKYINKAWNSNGADKSYYIDSNGVIHEDTGWNGFWNSGINTKNALDRAMSEHAKLQEKKESLQKDLIDVSEGISKVYTDGNGNIGIGIATSPEDIQEKINEVENQMRDVSLGVNIVFDDENFKDLKYGMSDEIDTFLDEMYAYQLKWRQTQGEYVKSDAISSMFDATSTEEMQEFGKALREISDNDSLTDEQKNQQILDKIDAIDKTADAYNRLEIAMSAVGVTEQDIADYFALETGAFNSSTAEGLINQYSTAKTALDDLKSGAINLDDLVKYDPEKNEATGRIDKIAEQLKGVGLEVREQFASIVEAVKEGTMNYDEAIKKLELQSMQSVINLAKTELESANKLAFPDLEVSGWIDSVDELRGAFESLADTMDLIVAAQEQMDNSGRISMKTALDLMVATDDWNQILEVNNGIITMNANAEQILIQSKLDLIKANIDMALQQVETDIALMEGAINSTKAGNAFTQGFTKALTNAQGILVGLKAGWDAFWAGEDVASAFNNARQSTVDNLTPDESSLGELYAQRDKLQQQREMLNGVDTTRELKDNYDFNKTPGDKYGDSEDDAFQKEMDYWENRLSANQAKADRLQGQIDLLEQKGMKASAQYYKDQMAFLASEDANDGIDSKMELLKGQLDAVTTRLGQVKEGSEEWWEAAKEYNDIVNEIQEIESAIVDLQDAIAEIDTYKFEEFNKRLDDITSKLGTIRNLIASDEEDWFDDEGNWTDDGIAVLGTYVQELETYKQGYKEIQGYLDDLSKYEYNEANSKLLADKFGIHSEQEYYDRMEELMDQQYDYAESINDTEESIVDMYESSIDAVEEYFDTLIDGYNDYIDSVKEALDAERDLYDFKKNVQKQAKDISELERRIASLSGSTNKADIAERRKLEAQLYESRESLSDTYYDHAKDSQQDALDAEQEAYEETMTRMVEGMRTSLEEATTDMETFLNSVTIAVSMNADTVLEKYRDTEVPLNDALTNPWEEAAEKAKQYGKDANNLMDVWKRDGYFAEFKSTASVNLSSPWSAGTSAASKFGDGVKDVMQGVVDNVAMNVSNIRSQLATINQEIKDTEARAASANVTVNTENTNYSGTVGSPQISTPTQERTPDSISEISRIYGLSNSQILDLGYGPISLAKFEQLLKDYQIKYSALYKQVANMRSDERLRKKVLYGQYVSGPLAVKKHAKGTTGTKRDEWAITDEPQFGDELVLVPGKDGNLSFMRKGTGVVPADLTANLIEWGQFTPDAMDLGGSVNVNMINNAVNKPEFNFAFDALVKAESITEETLPAVKKLVTQELNRFTKELNYALKGKGAR